MKAWRYRWLRHRGYKIDTIVDVRHIDYLFSNVPRVAKRSSKLVMRKGLSTRKIRFRRLTVEQLEEALIEEI